jgi:phospholipid transport system transporter-binding protein
MHRLSASLTIAEANAAVQAFEHELAPGEGPFVIDAGALQSFDTAAIAVLLEARRQAVAIGRGLVVRAAPKTMVDLAGLYGVAELLAFESPRS